MDRRSQTPPTVTIVIATYNADAYLPRTLRSIEAQSAEALAEVEVLVVDGGSHDRTLQLARDSAIVDRIVSESDRGIYDAMNKGGALAEGEWLHFLNAGDAFASPDSLIAVLDGVRRARAARSPWFVSGARNLGGAVGARATRIPNLPHNWWRHAIGVQPHCHQACWFSRDVFSASGGYSLSYGTAGDFDIVLRFGLLGQPAEDRRILIDYLGGGVSETTRSRAPELLHRVRTERMQLHGAAAFFDFVMARAVHAVNEVRVRLGRFRRAGRRMAH